MYEKHRLLCDTCKIETYHGYKSFLDRRPAFAEMGNGRSFENRKYLEYYECENCNNERISFKGEQIFPHETFGKPLPKEVPLHISKTFDEARLVRKFSPRASCALLRICLEEILIEASKVLYDADTSKMVENANNAHRKIEILKSKKDFKFRLDEGIWDFAEKIKELGNDNSHAIQKIPDSDANETFGSLCLFIEEIAKNLISKLDLKQKLESITQNIANKS